MSYDRIVDSVVLDSAMTVTANAIREKTGSTERITWSETKGFSDSVGDVYEVGKKAERDDFWDAVQNHGNRAEWQYGFAYWNCEYIRPKHRIAPAEPASTIQTFRDNKRLKVVEKEYFDFSNCKRATYSSGSYYYTFCACPSLEVIEDIGMKNVFSFGNTFARCIALHTIECIYPDESTLFDGAFANCEELVYLRVNGVIGQNGFNVQWSTKLDKESHISIVNAFSTTATISATLSKAAVDKAFETSAGANDGSASAEWQTLRATRPNVTILLA